MRRLLRKEIITYTVLFFMIAVTFSGVFYDYIWGNQYFIFKDAGSDCQDQYYPMYIYLIEQIKENKLCLNSGWSKSKTVKAIYEKGYCGSISNAFEHLCRIEQKEKKCFEPQPYVRTMTECLKYKTGSTGKEKDYITREGVFRHMWMNTELTEDHKKYIYEKYPNIWELHCCIKLPV